MGTRSKPAVMGHSAHARIALVLCLVAFSCAVLGHKLQAAPAHLVEDGAGKGLASRQGTSGARAGIDRRACLPHSVHLWPSLHRCLWMVCAHAAIRTELVEAGRTEGFLSKLFGTDCYSSAVRRLDADCRCV